MINKPLLCTAYRYLGCFKDGLPHAIAEMKTYNLELTISQCDEACALNGYKYFGLQNSQECSCTNNEDYDKFGPSTECNMPCDGNSSEICGGFFDFSVYEVDVPRIRMFLTHYFFIFQVKTYKLFTILLQYTIFKNV